MSVYCPLGHLSETDDWCDQCGAQIMVAVAADGGNGIGAGSPGAASPGSGGTGSGGTGSGTGGTGSGGIGTAGTDGGAADLSGAAAGTAPMPADAGVPLPSRTPIGWVTGPWALSKLSAAGHGAPASTPPAGRHQAAAAPGRQEASCPVCQTAREQIQRFCEECGYDYVTGKAPPGSGHSRRQLITEPTPPPDQAVEASAGWLVEIAPDRTYFDLGDDGSAPFPTDTPTRLIVLQGNRTLIGRRSRSRRIFPQIDLSLPPEDIGVSRSHALLEHPPGGPLTVTDLGSANGTWLGDDLRRAERGIAVRLADGARLYVGSWTRITLRAR